MTARELLKELQELTEGELDRDIYIAQLNDEGKLTHTEPINTVQVWPDMIVLE